MVSPCIVGVPWVLLLRRLECCELFRRRGLLVLGLPLRERLAVDAFARGVLVELDAALGGRFAVPVGQAVAAEARGIIRSMFCTSLRGVQMIEQAPERGGLEFGVDSVMADLLTRSLAAQSPHRRE